MSRPLTFGRSWLFNAGNLCHTPMQSALIQNQQSLLAIKNVLKGGAGQFGWTNQAGAAAAAPTFWTVYYSATNLVAGVAGDGVDRWSAYTDLVWNTGVGANSWIVLRNATAGLYWLISCENAGSDSNTLDMWISTDAFVGGSTTARPTAPSEYNMLVSTFWGSGNAQPIRFHVLMSTDGMATRMFTNYQLTMKGAWFIETMTDVTDNVNGDLLAVAFANSAGNALDSNSMTQTPRPLSRTTAGRTIYGIFTGEGSRYASNIQAALPSVDRTLWNDVAASDQVTPVGVSGAIASGSPMNRGHIGSVIDLWWGSDFVPTGMSFPSGYGRQLITQGPLVIPWNTLIARTF